MSSQKQRLSLWDQAARDADLLLELPGGVPMFFRRIPPGSLRMGSRGHNNDEEPIHRVVINREFYLGAFVVTQEQYQAVASRCPALKRNPDPSGFKGPRRPVEQVSWEDATGFCAWLARWKALPPDITEIRLPNEAEWEYACRADTETDYYNGDGEAALAEVGWFDSNSNSETHPVDERPESHPLGLYGMYGNVFEWCQDVYDAMAYRKRIDGGVARGWTFQDAGAEAVKWGEGPADEENALRVLRGGSWIDSAGDCRSAFRVGFRPGVRDRCIGFRVCLVRGPAAGRGAPQPGREAEPAPGDGGRGTRPESEGAGAAPSAALDLAQADFPREAGRRPPDRASIDQGRGFPGIPTGFSPLAQGWPVLGPTLGNRQQSVTTLKGLQPSQIRRCNPVGILGQSEPTAADQVGDDAPSRARIGRDETTQSPPRADILLRAEKAHGGAFLRSTQ